MHSDSCSWNTDAELAFIDKLGSFTKTMFTRKQLLTNYIRSLEDRADWHRLDKDRIIAYAKEALKKEGK